VSDYKNNPPPDDYSKTTPNINIPSRDDEAPSDWDKTNYKFPKQPMADDWGKTVTNIKPIDTGSPDLGKTMYPGAKKQPSSDWDVTRQNIDAADFGSSPDDFGGVADKTTPYFKLPEAERAKYQNLPPTPTEQAAREQQEQKAKGGIPTWVWVLGGLFAMFFFAIIILGIVLFIITRPTDFEVIVRSAPAGSDVRVDNESWGLPEADGSKRIPNLRAGSRTISIVHPTQVCKPLPVDGKGGEVKEVIAQCDPAPVKPGEDCTAIGIGDEEKAERCYYAALDALPDKFTADQLVRALNILIINFETGSSDIPTHRQAALNRGATFIKQLPPDIVLEVGGHTDNVGSDASNLTLSQARAAAVKTYLTAQGVRDATLQTRGYGATQPREGADNSTAQGRFLNRRIQYSVVQKQ
jgi:outer membrane protein OmpA-like peptidoglycan-associated protein